MELMCGVYTASISPETYESIAIQPNARFNKKRLRLSRFVVDMFSSGKVLAIGECTEDDARRALADLGVNVDAWTTNYKAYGWKASAGELSFQRWTTELVRWGENGRFSVDENNSVFVGHANNADEAAELFEKHVYTKFSEFDEEFRRRIMVPRCLAIRKKVCDLVLRRVYEML